MQERDSRTPKIMLASGMFLSGTVGLFAYLSGQPANNIVFFRCAFGAIALFAWAFLLSGPRTDSGDRRTNWPIVLISGAALVVNWFALFEAFDRTSIGLATIIYHLQPFWVVLIGFLFLDENIDRHRAQWILTGFFGLVLVVAPTVTSVSTDAAFVIGLLFALIASAFYALTAITTRMVVGIRPEILSGIHCLIGLVLFMPFLSFAELQHAAVEAWGALALIGTVHTGIVYVLIYTAYRSVSLPVMAVSAFMNPIAAFAIDIFFFNVGMSLLQLAGVVAILGSGLAINMRWRGLFGRSTAVQ
jgi:drug/metabolite transporter (DMT)-like permease